MLSKSIHPRITSQKDNTLLEQILFEKSLLSSRYRKKPFRKKCEWIPCRWWHREKKNEYEKTSKQSLIRFPR